MCGIVGIKQKENVDPRELKKAIKILNHRGPDQAGMHIEKNFGLGHTRLSVIDLSEKAKQPIHNEKKTLWIVYNGELYNYKAIKDELRKKGHHFYSKSDTEVILHAYEEYGYDCVKKFNGMFAFTIYDSLKKQFYLARDRLGIKPLYYYSDKENFFFASEIKAILELGIKPELNEKILYDYLNYFMCFTPETLFKNIKQFPPATYAVITKDNVETTEYWDVKYSSMNFSEKYFAYHLKNKIEDSIKQRLMSDVPIGAFLSGGIDSSAIVALMSTMQDNVKTFSVGFEDYDDELNYADYTAKTFNTDHHEVVVSAEQFARELPKMIWHFDLPITFPSAIPLYFVSKLSKGKATVVLSGEGADELFSGYHKYYRLLKINKYGKLLNFTPFANTIISKKNEEEPDPRVKKYYEMMLNGVSLEYATGLNVFYADEREEALKKKLKPYYKSYLSKLFNKHNTDFLNKLLYLDMKTYLVDLLMKQDKMSMAASIESRVPFLDHNIVEFAAKIPPNLKQKGKVGKYILKKSVEKILPQKIVHQEKRGFPVPINPWFKNELKDYASYIITDGDFVTKYFKKDYIKRILERQSTENHSLKIWGLLNLELWHQKFFQNE